MRRYDLRRAVGVASARNVAVAAAYWLTGWGGLQLAVVHDQVTPLWPPTGVALAALLLLGPRVWPGIALGAFAVNVAIGPTIVAVLVIAAGNTAAPVVAYLLLLRRAGFQPSLRRLTDALALVFIGGLGATLISATVGSLTLLVAGVVTPATLLSTWSVWWTGDAMGVLLVAPLLLVMATAPPAWTRSPLRWVEAVGLLCAAVVAMTLAVRSDTSLLFPAYPFVVWAAVRFQLSVAMPCAIAGSLVATVAAGSDAGPFAGVNLAVTMVSLQALNFSLALVALLLSAVISERDQAHHAIEDTCQQLSDALTQLGAGNVMRLEHLDSIAKSRQDPDPPSGGHRSWEARA
ncbi:MAG: hypothetical protein GEU86_05320 [Actinophytocola sp.]|nr:hypothetical protein [Actinophytocola sp.]